MTDWRLLMNEGRFEEAEPLMLEATSKPDPYGDLLIQKAAFYESWGDALGATEDAVRKYWLSHAEWAWFASGATSGGEGTARMMDLNRVLKKIEGLKC